MSLNSLSDVMHTQRSQNPNPEAYVTLAGLPVTIQMQWPFHGSGSGGDFYLLHGAMTLQDGSGTRLPDGSYLCLATTKSLSGRISQRIGSLELSGSQVNLQAIDRLQMTDGQQQTVGPLEPEAGISVLQPSEVA